MLFQALWLIMVNKLHCQLTDQMKLKINATLRVLTALLHRQLPSLKLSSIELSDCNGSVFWPLELNEGEAALHHNLADVSTATSKVTFQILAS